MSLLTEKPGAVDLDIDHKQGEKTDEEELTFNEWAQKVLAEEEKEKHGRWLDGQKILYAHYISDN